MSDLVEDLRKINKNYDLARSIHITIRRGADRIEALEAELAALKADMAPKGAGEDEPLHNRASRIADQVMTENRVVPSPMSQSWQLVYAGALAAFEATKPSPDNTAPLVEALTIADDAIAEMFRYFDGGEMRGSYDGKPERTQLRKAGYAVRQALAAHRANNGEGK